MRLKKGMMVTPLIVIAWELHAYGHRYWGMGQEDDAWRIELGHCIYYFRKATPAEITRGTFLDIFTRE